MWSLGNLRPRCKPVWFLMRAVFMVYKRASSHCVLTWWREIVLLMYLLIAGSFIFCSTERLRIFSKHSKSFLLNDPILKFSLFSHFYCKQEKPSHSNTLHRSLAKYAFHLSQILSSTKYENMSTISLPLSALHNYTFLIFIWDHIRMTFIIHFHMWLFMLRSKEEEIWSISLLYPFQALTSITLTILFTTISPSSRMHSKLIQLH